MGRTITRLVALLPLACLGHSSAFAAWQSYSSQNGLTSNTVQTVLADHRGRLWIVTDAPGAGMYDGIAWHSYRTADGLPSDTITAIVEDRDGILWFGTPYGVSRYDGVSWAPIMAPGALTTTRVDAILMDSHGLLWVGTPTGAAFYDGTGWTAITRGHGLLNPDVTAIVEDRRGHYWFGSVEDGVSRFDGNEITTYGPLLNGNILSGRSMALDSLGNLWFSGGSGSVWRFNGTTWREYTVNDGLANAAAGGPVFADRSGIVWLSQKGFAVSRFDGAHWRNLSTLNTQARDGLPAGNVQSITQDPDGNLWFATQTDGLIRFDGSAWRTYTLWPGGASQCNDCGLKDHLGNLWYAANGKIHKFDGFGWQTYPEPTTMSYNSVYCALEMASGKLWFGTFLGVLEFDPATNVAASTGTFDYRAVLALHQDRSGTLWVCTAQGIYRSNPGGGYTVYTRANTSGGLPSDQVFEVAEDRAGNHWFSAGGSIVRLDTRGAWTTFRDAFITDPDGVTAILVDHLGNLWFGSRQALTRFDGTSWQDLVPDEGSFGAGPVNSIFEDADHDLWVGTTSRGVLRYDGAEWGALTGTDGLQSSEVRGILQDPSGAIWFGGLSAVSGLDLDRRAPRPVVVLGPPAVSPNRSPTVVFGAAYAESYGLSFSTSFDGGPWTGWSTTTVWSASDLEDGTYEVRVRARDKIGNVSATPAVARFEIDATPPAAQLAYPSSQQVVRDSITIVGSAADARFREYLVEWRMAGDATWTALAQSATPVASGALAGWNTRRFPDGVYELRLTVADTIGLSSTAGATVTIDNQFPSADVTMPVLVREAEGGSVYTTTGATHVYFPPHAFAQDAMVSAQPTPSDSVPASLGSGVSKVHDGFDLDWTAPLLKPARLDVSLSSVAGALDGIVLYHSPGNGATWSRLGGTLDADARSLSLAVTRPGRYAAFKETVSPQGGRSVSGLAFTPRVFSPRGTFADRVLGISFSIGTAAPVTVRVYSLSGRLIREVANGLPMSAGQNIVRWDGRDRDGVIVNDGAYLVSVEALGESEKKPIAVVR